MPQLRKLKRRPGVHLDMTPMVDIMMLLLIFFMCTTQFKVPQLIEVLLPESRSEFKVPEANVLSIYVPKEGSEVKEPATGEVSYITREGDIFWDLEGDTVVTQHVHVSYLPEVLIQNRIKNPKLMIVVKTDRYVKYGVMEDLMNVLQDAQITRFSLVTLLETEGTAKGIRE